MASYEKTQASLEDLQQALASIRERARTEKWGSWTSQEYQDDVVNFLIDNRQMGCGVIEVGCFRGGLSAQLACVCRHFRWPFYAMDIDDSAVKHTTEQLDRLNLGGHSVVFQGPIQRFVQNTRLHQQPVAIVIDGDHQYDAVREDIQAVYRLNRVPFAAVFHDYSLRHPTTGERVDQAIHHTFGGDVRIRKIGLQFSNHGSHPSKLAPSADGHYWDTPGSEGAIVQLPPASLLRN